MSRRDNHQRVEHVAPEKLKVSKRQARVHPETQIEALAKSISRFGLTVPILIDEHARVLAGHARLLAAQRLGLQEVPCLRVNHLSAEEKRAYVLADNRLAEMARWDKEVLAGELQDLGDLGFPVELTGFELPAIDMLLSEVEASSPDTQGDADDETPDPEEAPVTVAGDLWRLGRHLLFCGDARDPGAYVRLLGTDVADVTFCDPPFNRSILRDLSRQSRRARREFAMASGEMSSDEFRQFLSESLNAIRAVSRDGAILFVVIDWRSIKECIVAGQELGLELKNVVVWNKTNAGMGRFYRSQHELICVWKVGTAPHVNTFGLGAGGRSRTNVWTYAGVNTFKRERTEELDLHVNIKPVALIIDALKDVSHRGQTVLDAFGGSGTTLIAAERCGRIARLIEIDPIYCDVTVRRFERLTGKFAYLAGTDRTFDDVARERSAESPDRKALPPPRLALPYAPR